MTRFMGWFFVLLIFTPIFGWTAEPRLQLRVDSCVKVDLGAVGKLVALELKATISDSTEGDVVRVAVTCQSRFVQIRVDDPQTREAVVNQVDDRPVLEIRVDDPVTGKTLQRFVDLSLSENKTHSRLLALAIVELVSASWLEAVANPTPKVPPLKKVQNPNLQKEVATRATMQGTDVFVAPQVVAQFSKVPESAWFYGGGVRTDVYFNDTWGLGADNAVTYYEGERLVGAPRVVLSTLNLSLLAKQELQSFLFFCSNHLLDITIRLQKIHLLHDLS